MSAGNSQSGGPVSVDMKVVLLGKQYVGKTALMERFLHERFLSEDGYQSTIGAAYGSKRVRTKSGGSIVLGVWDTAGQEHYESLARIYYRGSAAAIVCYDITEPGSLARAQFWVAELAKFEPRCRLYVCGCKLDLAAADPEARRVSAAAVRQFASSVGAPAVETSSKTGENVPDLFTAIAEDFVRAGGGSSSGGASFPLHSRQQPQPGQQTQGQRCGC